jgi:hypothetical protein
MGGMKKIGDGDGLNRPVGKECINKKINFYRSNTQTANWIDCCPLKKCDEKQILDAKNPKIMAMGWFFDAKMQKCCQHVNFWMRRDRYKVCMR